jgi:AcrR family transcriptional regulator
MFATYNKVQKSVLETTLRIIIEKELQATSMSLIAKESGVSTGSIYHYFESKEDIINELYKGIVTFNGGFVLKDFHKNESIRERFHKAWENLFQLSINYPQGFQFIEQYSFSPYIHLTTKQEAYKGGWCGPLEKLYAEAMEQQLFIHLDPGLMVQMHYGSIVYLVKGHVQKHFDLTDDVIQTVIRSSWNSVSKEKDSL